MKHYLGIDLGTSSVKLLLVNSEGEIVRSASSGYELIFPKPDCSDYRLQYTETFEPEPAQKGSF